MIIFNTKKQNNNTNPYQRLLEVAPYALGILPTFAFAIYSVWIRIQKKYLQVILAQSGESLDSASFFDYLFIYRMDLFFLGALAPLLIIVSYLTLSRKLASLIWLSITTLTLLLLYANLQSWGQVGRFLTLSALVDAISFGLSKPNFIFEYLAIDGLIKLLILTLISFLIFTAIHHLNRFSIVFKFFALISLLIIPVSATLAALGSTSNINRTELTKSFVLNSIKALLPTPNITKEISKLSNQQLFKKYQILHNTSSDESNLANKGVEKGSNLILFVLETGSIEFLDVRKSLPSHAVWKTLSDYLYIGSNHYSVFPASAESNLAILAGMYPPRAYYDTCLTNLQDQESIPTVIDSFTKNGTKTAVYLPYTSQVPMDKVVFEHTGFQKVFYGDQNRLPGKSADITALSKMLGDIDEWLDKEKQFVVAFFPQLGHGPWSSELGDSIADRGKTLALQQLDWIKQITDLLEAKGALKNTVIIITGDHGVRTTGEDPLVRVGMIDKYSLHVPLIIYAPNAKYPHGVVDTPTSHIDIPAEISHLFGIPRHPLQQGLPLLSPTLGTRNQYFMANWYFGADGYRTVGESAMYSNVLNVTFARDDGIVQFNSSDIVKNEQKIDSVQSLLESTLDLQHAWIERFACSNMLSQNHRP